jgi:hypothetical protein
LRNQDEPADDTARRGREMEETYINDYLQDESISYLVQLMKKASELKHEDEETK